MSGWKTVTVDENGAALPEGLFTPSEIRVDVRRDRVQVDDETAWSPGPGFPFPTVLSVEYGELQYRDVRLQVTRGPQDGVYVIAHWSRYPDPSSGVTADSRWMFGCGVRTGDATGRSAGVGAEAVSFLTTFVRSHGLPDPDDVGTARWLDLAVLEASLR